MILYKRIAKAMVEPCMKLLARLQPNGKMKLL
jgi:hypothetical protein